MNKRSVIIYTNKRSQSSNSEVKLMKRYKIKNRFRFISFVTIMMLVVSFSVSALFTPAQARSEEEQKYIEVLVESGDTLWDLAKTYGNEGMDIRQIVYDICSINNIKAADLRAGQTILIPVD